MHDECQIVHRDLKPENVLLEKEGEMDNLRLIDFGTAKCYKNLKGANG
jgi:serine/threonine protein kinase